MKRFFVDTNIIIDLIADRKPFSNSAVPLFELAEKGEIHLFTSSHSIATTHYVLIKYIDDKTLRQVLYELMNYLHIVPINGDILKKGLKSKNKDFEDALQLLCAYSIGKIECLVTRNIKDFRDSEIPVMTADGVLQRFKDY